MGICIYIWNVATESEVADTIGSTATSSVHRIGNSMKKESYKQ